MADRTDRALQLPGDEPQRAVRGGLPVVDEALARVEAGAQGEHKLARGYLPVETHSLHWIGDPGFSDAVNEYLEAERKAVGEDIDILTAYGPFRKVMEEPK